MGNGNHSITVTPNNEHRFRQSCECLAQVNALTTSAKSCFKGSQEGSSCPWLCALLVDLLYQCLFTRFGEAKKWKSSARICSGVGSERMRFRTVVSISGPNPAVSTSTSCLTRSG